ncbi:YcjX family protein [Marinivivus vitaminiproducens]|uniref:YcjX family protein n=1 Tax=Marinivivus vitaminiproducens TaxID=3035935 RepID=UPI00279EA3C2|nr:YcjX family protein [Geminicoccaceae bacterium SCSIO 64248]
MTTSDRRRAAPGMFDLVPSFGDLQRGLELLTDTTLDRRCRLAVTGLRHSGKTVFLTAIVHHLLSGRQLPFMEAVHEQRLVGARLTSAVDDLPEFPYRAFNDALTGISPTWPKATDRLSGMSVTLRFKPRNALMRQIRSRDTLKLELIDYPGEWLLDLPLLQMDYATWCESVFRLAEHQPRAALARDWLAATADAALDAPLDETEAERLARLYTDYLVRCQHEAGLSVVQPGRFTMPGDLAGSELLRFAPLPPGPSPRGSLRAAFAERYERYRYSVAQPFFADHFAKVDRQVVLVDVLETLNRGPDVFADTQRAMEAILQGFSYGRSSWFSRIFNPRIDRALFAATKADHVAANQHPNLKLLMQHLVEHAAREAVFEGVRIETLALASIRSTDTVRTEHQGQVLSCVKGVLRDDGRETVLFPGEIPPHLPEPIDWTTSRFRFRAFAPRRLGVDPASHLRLDQALEFLIGDRLR